MTKKFTRNITTLKKTVQLTFLVYYRKNQIKKGRKRLLGKCREKPDSPGCLLRWSRMARSLPAAMGGICHCCPPGQLPGVWKSRVFSGGSVPQACGACLHDWPQPLRLQPLTEQTVHHKSQGLHALSAQTGSSCLRPREYKNTLVGQTIPRAQSSSPKSWPSISHKEELLLRMCRTWAPGAELTLSCMANCSLLSEIFLNATNCIWAHGKTIRNYISQGGNLRDIDNSVVAARGRGWEGQMEESIGWISSDGQRLNLGW